MAENREDRNAWAVFRVFLRLGLTSFGGPVAHIGYFREEFVTRRGWLSERAYADLVALCQFLPGPASSQVGLAIGLTRGGYGGALAAWLGFTLPSALALILFALGLTAGAGLTPGVLQGLKIVAVAVVAQAVWGMARQLCPDRKRLTLMAVATLLVLALPSAWGQLAVMAAAAVAGMVLFSPRDDGVHAELVVPVTQRTALVWLVLFFGLLAGLPVIAVAAADNSIDLFDAFYRAGSLVFGGGHVVLPLLQSSVVPPGWVDNDTFLAGYGAAQAVPGPLFTFSAFLGASISGVPGGLLCLVAIFLPSWLLVAGVLPFWARLRTLTRVRAALMGVNAAVVGLLLAALYDPVWSSAIRQPGDFGLALTALVALMVWRLPPWLVVAGSAGVGALLL